MFLICFNRVVNYSNELRLIIYLLFVRLLVLSLSLPLKIFYCHSGRMFNYAIGLTPNEKAELVPIRSRMYLKHGTPNGERIGT